MGQICGEIQYKRKSRSMIYQLFSLKLTKCVVNGLTYIKSIIACFWHLLKKRLLQLQQNPFSINFLTFMDKFKILDFV